MRKRALQSIRKTKLTKAQTSALVLMHRAEETANLRSALGELQYAARFIEQRLKGESVDGETIEQTISAALVFVGEARGHGNAAVDIVENF